MISGGSSKIVFKVLTNYLAANYGKKGKNYTDFSSW